MLPLNQLTAAERFTFDATIRGLFGSYEMKTTVQLLNNQHGVISTISHKLLDGQVDGEAVVMRDGEVDVSMRCMLEFSDPQHTLSIDSNAPTDGALYLDRMVRVIVSVRCSFGWVDVPQFTGPITGPVNRDGDILSVKAAGKETFALRSAWETYHYKTGYNTSVLRGLLVRAGELTKYMELPSGTSRISKPITIGRETKLWNKAFALASSFNTPRILFYDARGVARTSPKVTKPVITFATGEGGLLTGEPQISFSVDNLKNAIIVKGGDPAGPKTVVSALVVAPKSHQLSPWKIGRSATSGRGGYLTMREDNGNLRTFPKAIARGKALLDQFLLMGTEATWECLPVWHLEPWDIANISAKFTGTVRIRSFSRSFGPEPTMTCGYTKDLRRPSRVMRSAA